MKNIEKIRQEERQVAYRPVTLTFPPALKSRGFFYKIFLRNLQKRLDKVGTFVL